MNNNKHIFVYFTICNLEISLNFNTICRYWFFFSPSAGCFSLIQTVSECLDEFLIFECQVVFQIQQGIIDQFFQTCQ